MRKGMDFMDRKYSETPLFIPPKNPDFREKGYEFGIVPILSLFYTDIVFLSRKLSLIQLKYTLWLTSS